jgi:hypothetical protein
VKRNIIAAIIIATIVAILVPDSFARTQMGNDIIKGKYVCLVKMIDKNANIKCGDTFTAHKLHINYGKGRYIVRDIKDRNFSYICFYNKKENLFVECK